MNAGAGTFSVPLEGIGVNRVRFAIPSGDSGEPRAFYISYVHGDNHRSRFTEFSSVRAPLGKDDLDYRQVAIHRSEFLLPHLEYATFETAENTMRALTDKRISRFDVGPINLDSCDHLSRNSPALGRILRYDLEAIQNIVRGPRMHIVAKDQRPADAAASGRGPASVVVSK